MNENVNTVLNYFELNWLNKNTGAFTEHKIKWSN